LSNILEYAFTLGSLNRALHVEINSSTYCENRGQEFKTPVIINSNAPQWNTEFTFGIGPSTTELTLTTFLVETDRCNAPSFG
jgi:hypothetical protein